MPDTTTAVKELTLRTDLIRRSKDDFGGRFIEIVIDTPNREDFNTEKPSLIVREYLDEHYPRYTIDPYSPRIIPLDETGNPLAQLPPIKKIAAWRGIFQCRIT